MQLQQAGLFLFLVHFYLFVLTQMASLGEDTGEVYGTGGVKGNSIMAEVDLELEDFQS
jgi:hypothetical protein